MQVADRLTLDSPRRTADGYLIARAKVARTGIYDYAGFEVDPQNEHGLRDKPIVKVFRPGDQVFDRASLASFVGKPVTNDHPTTPVNADNWRDLARGTVMGAVRDGEYVAFDLMLTDKAAIAAVESGKRELSNGYSCDLKFEAGTAPDGQTYDAVQTAIRGNHIALVDQGRAGPECRITDRFAACDANPAALSALSKKEPVMAGTIVVDGLPVSLADEAAVRAVLEKKDAAIAEAQNALDAVKGELETANGKIAALDSELSAAKAAASAEKLDQLVADRAALIVAAKAAVPSVVTDGKSAAEIRKAVVVAKLGDNAPTSDEAIAGAFAVLTASDAAPQVQNINPAIVTNDAAASLRMIRAARYN